MALARVGDIELDYERTGSGPPLLAIMGMSGTALHWGEPFLEPLREHFEVIVYDPPRRRLEQPARRYAAEHRADGRGRGRAARGAGAPLSARARHLDGPA